MLPKKEELLCQKDRNCLHKFVREVTTKRSVNYTLGMKRPSHVKETVIARRFGRLRICLVCLLYTSYRVGIISQPDFSTSDSMKEFGRPRYGFFIGGGNVDSMVAHYSVAKIRRDKDEYTPVSYTHL